MPYHAPPVGDLRGHLSRRRRYLGGKAHRPSQAATSQALAELENQLQRRLFDRNGRRIVGNTAARDLLPAATQMLDRVSDIAAAAGHRPLNLKLCASLTAGNAFLDLAAVGVHIAAFEACSSFTRVTACQITRPPCVDFVARFRSTRLPALTARQLSNLTMNCSSGSFPRW